MTEKKEMFEYSVKMNYMIGASAGSMSWNAKTPLTPELLTFLIEAIKAETGTTKDVFITSVFVTKGDPKPFDEIMERLKK